jgi:NAD-dependent SIR2 family protein deacetylase
MEIDIAIEHAAAAVGEARALVVTAGAGIGVDSGLPDFRGDRGFWNAYPPFERLGLSFVDLANPAWFRRDPGLAWGFYGHRLELYRRTVPHEGFAILRRWMERAPDGGFVFTSNVDGQFQKAAFSPHRITECHGSIHVLQCLRQCGVGLFPADPYLVSIDLTTMRAEEPFPACPRCGSLARPNILMFGDWEWDAARAEQQQRALEKWRRSVSGPLVVVECGAGTAVPTVRMFSEQVTRQFDGTLVRVNLREADGPGFSTPGGPTCVSLPLGTLEALRAVDAVLTR